MNVESHPSFTYSCRLEVLPGERLIDKLINAKRFGFDAVSLPGRFLSSYLEDLRACRADSPLPTVTMSLGFTGSLVSPNRDIRKKCHDSLLALFDVCAELGATVFNMPPALIQDNLERITDPGPFNSVIEFQDALLLEHLPALGEEARKRGVTLVLEPVNRYESRYFNTVPHAARICEKINHEHVGVTCDFYHMQLEELKMERSILDAGKWIRHVHVAENTRVEPGSGSMNFTPGFHALKKLGYNRIVELECRILSGPAEEVLPQCVHYIHKLWQEA